MLKVYLVQVEQEEPFRLNLEEVYSIDNEHRALCKEEVLWLTEERDPQLITLRIRHDSSNVANSVLLSSFTLVE